nr:glycoside hydrolase [uncultured Draconibacterium sp.]
MHLLLKLNITLVIISVLSANLFGQDNIEPVAYYSFNNDNIADEKEYSELFLRNKTSLYNDSERGPVLRFNSESKSYAAINKNLLNSDSCTISFYFFWESTDAGSWHQLFEVFDSETKSNFFFTPQNGWGNNMCSVISDKKEYSLYQAVNAPQLVKNEWLHVAITIAKQNVTVFINGEEKSRGYLTFTPSTLQADSLFFGGNPHRSDNFYISARLDDIKIYHKALATNQVAALYNEKEIPPAENNTTNWDAIGSPLDIEIDLSDKKQTIQNFGASDGWNTERIGKYWPEDKKEKLAELLFSTEKDEYGDPVGIGLSAWRFNIGAGTAEQGEASRISIEDRRTECFLNPDGATYNWNKQIGQQYFLRKAAIDYNVNHIIGWQNSPPVIYTKNNLGFRDIGTPTSTILEAEHFDEFARFLGDIVEHFSIEGVHFDYISPLNEPQYNWSPSEAEGTVTQEGTPWTNQEIHDVVKAIGNEFSDRNIETKLFVTEAGSIHYHTSGSGHASSQLNKFWNQSSSYSLLGTPAFANIVSYHSYWKDFGTELVSQRENFYNQSQLLNPVPEAWQTEYSLLGEGYNNGYPEEYKLSEMECALSLARVIMIDLNVANTTGWQWWTTFEKGKHGGEARYCLIEAFTEDDSSDGFYYLNKLFYTFGNFSHFIRPGMKRLGIFRSDNLKAYQEISDVMFSAYTTSSEDKIVMIAVNTTADTRKVNLTLKNSSGKELDEPLVYLTDAYTSLSVQDVNWASNEIIVPAHSVLTLTADLEVVSSIENKIPESVFWAQYVVSEDIIDASIKNNSHVTCVKLYSVTGKLIQVKELGYGQQKVTFSTSHLPDGIYLVCGEGNYFNETKKVVVVRQ